MAKCWTIEEDDIVRNIYPYFGSEITSKFLNFRKNDNILGRASLLHTYYTGGGYSNYIKNADKNFIKKFKGSLPKNNISRDWKDDIELDIIKAIYPYFGTKVTLDILKKFGYHREKVSLINKVRSDGIKFIHGGYPDFLRQSDTKTLKKFKNYVPTNWIKNYWVNSWASEEYSILKAIYPYYGATTTESVLRQFNYIRSTSSIFAKAKNDKIKKIGGGKVNFLKYANKEDINKYGKYLHSKSTYYWTEEEIKLLKCLYPYYGPKETQKVFKYLGYDKTKTSLYSKAGFENLKYIGGGKEDFLKYADKKTIKEISNILPDNNDIFWCNDEIDLLKNTYPYFGLKKTVEIFQTLGYNRSEFAILHQATQRKIKRNLNAGLASFLKYADKDITQKVQKMCKGMAIDTNYWLKEEEILLQKIYPYFEIKTTYKILSALNIKRSPKAISKKCQVMGIRYIGGGKNSFLKNTDYQTLQKVLPILELIDEGYTKKWNIEEDKLLKHIYPFFGLELTTKIFNKLKIKRSNTAIKGRTESLFIKRIKNKNINDFIKEADKDIVKTVLPLLADICCTDEENDTREPNIENVIHVR